MKNNDHEALLPHLKLQLSVNYPDLAELWMDGYSNGTSDEAEELNPYSDGTEENHFWQEGWWAGFYGEEPLFELANQHDLLLVNESVLVKREADEAVFVEPAEWQGHSTVQDKVQLKAKERWIQAAKIAGALLATYAMYEVADIII